MDVQFRIIRCFIDTEKVPILPITILVGENSSGKTSLLAGLNHIVALLDGSPVDLNTAPFQLGSFKDIVFSKFSRCRRTLRQEKITWNERDAPVCLPPTRSLWHI